MTIEQILREIPHIRYRLESDKYKDVLNEIENILKVTSVNSQESSDDLISREQLLKVVTGDSFKSDFPRMSKALAEIIKALPPVTLQEPKTGHWIEKDEYDGDTYYDCSECGESWTTIDGTPWQNGMNYCPNCGCRMESEE